MRRLKKLMGNVIKGKIKLYILLITVPIVLLLSFVTVFFISDNFTFYLYFLLMQNKSEQHIDQSVNILDDTIDDLLKNTSVPGNGEGVTVNDGQENRQGEYVSDFYITDGQMTPEQSLALMLLNSMNGGYYREYLELARDHANGKYMPDEFKPGTQNGKPLYPSIFYLLGAAFTETGLTDGVAPYSSINSGTYNPSKDITLSKVNSQWFRVNGYDKIVSKMEPSMFWKGSNYFTQFHLDSIFGAVNPNATMSITPSTVYPSKLNGYLMDSTRVRGRDETDFAYFPDQLAAVIQYGYASVKANVDMEILNKELLDGALYAAHNGGPGVLKSTWSTGMRAGSDYTWAEYNDYFDTNWAEYNGNLTLKQCSAASINEVGKLFSKIDQSIETVQTSTKFRYDNHPDFTGLACTSLLLNGGFIATPRSMEYLKYHMNDGGFMRGAWTAYRVFKDPVGTIDDVKNFLNSIKLQTMDESLYGATVRGKEDTKEIVVHMYTTQGINVYNKYGAGPLKLVHAYPMESTRGFFSVLMSGKYVYYKMLNASGVPCTLEEASADGFGRLIRVNKDSYYTGTRDLGNCGAGSTLPGVNSPMYYRLFKTSTGIHFGEDLNMRNDNLYAVMDGVVERVVNVYDSKKGTGYGNLVKVKVATKAGEPDVIYSYNHMKKVSNPVKEGQVVRQGDILGVSGDTGKGVALHLHINIWIKRNEKLHVLSYLGLYHKLYTMEYAPSMEYKLKDGREDKADEGLIYDKNMRVIGRLKDYAYKENVWSKIGWRKIGLNDVYEEALRAR